MSDDRKQDVDELFATDDSESNADASTTSADTSEEKEIDLGEENASDKKSNAQSERGKQVAAWTAKVLAGEVDIDKLPKGQQWLKGDIEKLLLKQSDTNLDDNLIDERLERKLSAREEERRFNEMSAELKSRKLDSYQKTQLEAEYKDLRSSGLSKAKALEKALKIVTVEDRATQQVTEQRRRMEIPHQGNYVGTDLLDATEADGKDPIFKKPEKERLAAYVAQMKGGSNFRR